MKQRYLFFLVILLAFGFIGCDTGTGTDTNGNGTGTDPANPFIGKWSCTAHDQGGDQFQEIEFYPDLTYLYVVDGVNNLKGTYSFTDAELTVIFTYSWDGDTWVKNDLNDPDSKDEGPYTIDGNSLTCLGNTYQLE